MEKQDCLIRIAQDNDFAGIMQLLGQLLPDDPIIKDGRDRFVYNKILQNPDLHIFVLILGAKIISTCYLNIIPNLTRNASPYGVIENVITDSSMQNKGYGKKIMQFVLDYAWQADCYKVMLQSAVKRGNAHKFYEACSFDPGEKFAFVARSPILKPD